MRWSVRRRSLRHSGERKPPSRRHSENSSSSASMSRQSDPLTASSFIRRAIAAEERGTPSCPAAASWTRSTSRAREASTSWRNGGLALKPPSQ